MSSRRAFLAALTATAVAPTFRRDALLRARDLVASGSIAGDDEDYWREVQRAFDLDHSIINLNNGGVSPTPTHVLDAMVRDLRFSNVAPVHHMWDVLEPRIEGVRRELAREFGCDPEELAITRNASESMETLILGLDLTRGDEVIVTTQNYPRMLTTWDQRERREGIVVKKISFAIPPRSLDDVVGRFREAITPRTRAIEVPHITNLSGQIMPVRDLVRLGRERNIEVLVDGAHSFAHFPFNRDALDCDWFGTSLHKWLLAPIGTGFLYVRRSKIPSLWPLMAAPKTMDANVRKYEEIGTHPAANHNAIAVALAFHRAIGAERKAARLRFLRDRWAKRLTSESDRCRVLTPLDDPRQACGIGLLYVDGMEVPKLVSHLWEKYRIITTPIVHAEFKGL
ncbi:MAG TPA: aminotransferase class V-fold PLP-dependent enzyme, partial [Gemmatimonadaceae bacterium]|nr:aminotransferase class V-fold PLP-dependent enzyme [Gemmatimonadaceae bacterium]